VERRRYFAIEVCASMLQVCAGFAVLAGGAGAYLLYGDGALERASAILSALGGAVAAVLFLAGAALLDLALASERHLRRLVDRLPEP
jgi:hypothetical protein